MSVERANLLRCRVLPVENGSSVDMVGLRRGRASYYNSCPGRNPPAGMKMGTGISVGGRHTVVPGAGQQFARGVAPHWPLLRPFVGSTQESMTKQQTPH